MRPQVDALPLNFQSGWKPEKRSTPRHLAAGVIRPHRKTFLLSWAPARLPARLPRSMLFLCRRCGVLYSGGVFWRLPRSSALKGRTGSLEARPPISKTSRDEPGTLASSRPQTEVPRSSAPPVPRRTGRQMSQSAASTRGRSGCFAEAECSLRVERVRPVPVATPRWFALTTCLPF